MSDVSNAGLAVLLPVNMGNRGQNVLPVRETFLRLRTEAKRAEFVAYHWRISGNFIFRYMDPDGLLDGLETGKRVTGLGCVVRPFDELQKVSAAIPSDAETVRGSVLVRRGKDWRVVFVALSQSVGADHRQGGRAGTRVEIESWPSDRDVICLYDRPGEAGDVGQVTRNVVGSIQGVGPYPYLTGTGRALSVVRDLLSGRGLRGEEGPWS